ncbi:uncharacterized protein [Nicotiana tomentosiformis]|uniref:uncharacterized protein n=1 Tax=Nicotiana tomentosiformis TaxID=4098 RepID=UPI00388CDBB9
MVSETIFEEEHLRLERFKNYHPPTFSCLTSEYAHSFLEECHYILCTMGMVRIFHRDASILFDPRSTYSYVSFYFDPYLDISRDSLSSPIYVSTPVGDYAIVDRVYRSCLVVISGLETRVDLLILSMADFDVILAMDWLLPYHAILDCYAKTVALAMPGLPFLEWRSALDYLPSMVVSFLKAHRMVDKGCDAYLASMRDASADTPTVKSVLVVRDFPDVWLAYLPGTQSISIPPYRMDPIELNELKEQLQELLDKGFIHPSVSSWGAPVLFVKKKDVEQG